MVVQLQRHADHLGPGLRGKAGDDRRVDPARHRDDDARALGQWQAEVDGAGDGHGRGAFTRYSPGPPRPDRSTTGEGTGLTRRNTEYGATGGRDTSLAHPGRRAAIACVLSAGEGWREATRMLGGAFAGSRKTGAGTRKTGLIDYQEE